MDREREQHLYSRQQFIIPRSIADVNIAVVGVGAIGRQVALALASAGAKNLKIIDHDRVSDTNTANQGYPPTSVGLPKVDVTGDNCSGLLHGQPVSRECSRWTPLLTDDSTVIFLCPDNMACREAVYKSFLNNPLNQLLIDTRMLGEQLRIVVADKEHGETVEGYGTTLISDEEAAEGRCTSDGAIHSAMVAAGYAVSDLARWLRKEPLLFPNTLINIPSRDCVQLEYPETASA